MSANTAFAGLRVLEFTHAVMGPACGLALADLGAEVIRVEPAPHGDPTRRLSGFGSGYYTFFNRNKKSLAVNLKDGAGYDAVCRLIKTADVLIENFGPGTMDRLGLGYDRVQSIQPAIVYCSLKGFLTGPYENRMALDEVVQMMSGLAYMTGPPGQPLRAGASIIDIMGGTFGALVILAALRERDQTGRGQLVRNGLFETAAFVMGQHMAHHATVEQPLPPMPARISAWAVYQPFDTANGRKVFIGVTSDKHWRQFCDAFNRPDLRDDQRLTTNNDRIAARDWLLPDLAAMVVGLSEQEVIDRCNRAGIPFAPIAQPEDLFDDPHLSEGGLLDIRLPDGRQTALPRLPVEMDGQRPDLRAQPPVIGEHTVDLLREVGLPSDQIDSLQKAGVITGPQE